MRVIKFFFKLILVLLLIVLSLWGVLLFMFIDGRDPSLIDVKYANLVAAEEFSADMTNTLENPDEDKYYFGLDEMEANSLFYPMVVGKKFSVLKIKGLRIRYLEQGKIRVEMPIKVLLFKSVLRSTFTIVDSGDYLTVQMSDMSVGKLKLKEKFFGKVRSKLKKVFNRTVGNDALSLDLSNMSATIKYSTIFDLLDKNSDSTDYVSLISFLGDFCLNNDLITLNLGNDGKYGFTLDTTNLGYNEASDGDSYEIDYDSVVAKSQALSGHGLSYKNSSAVFGYYTLGYGAISYSDKLKVEELNLDTSETGVKQPEKISIKDVLYAQRPNDIAQALINGTVPFVLSESQLNKTTFAQDFVGMGYAFTDGEKVAYISIESFTIDIKEDNFSLLLVINLNGKRLSFKTDFSCPATDDGTLRASLVSGRMGNKTFSSKYVTKFKSCLSKLVNGLGEWLSATDDGTLVIKLDEAVKSSNGIKELSQHVTVFNAKQTRAMEEKFQIDYTF